MNYSTGSLVRPKDGRILAGVCAAIAKAMKVDVSIVRVVVALIAVFSSGVGAVAYLIGWAVIPEEGSDTTGLDQIIGQVKDYKSSYDAKNAQGGTSTPAAPTQPPAPGPQATFDPYAEDDSPKI